MSTNLNELAFHVNAVTRALYVVTDEEDFFLRKLQKKVKKDTNETWVYTPVHGLVRVETLLKDWGSRSINADNDTRSVNQALEKVYKEDPKNKAQFYVFFDADQHLADPIVQRRVLDIMHQVHADKYIIKVLIFVSTRRFIPPKLSRYIQVIDDPGPTKDEVLDVLKVPCTALKYQIPEHPDKLFRGLTTFEIEAALSQNVVRSKYNPEREQNRIYEEDIHTFRKNSLRKTGLLDYMDTSHVNMSDVGGLDRFKAWVEEMRPVFGDEGREAGLTIPKGILLAGVWGTGKSLSAKMLGKEWKLPVVLLEMGKLRSSGVGDTEANAYMVTKLVESVAPCILWIDEAEKSLSGGQSSAATDSGTTARSLGIFSTWIQETTSPITLVLTANRLSTLPVEFVNRMDERFFFDLPSLEERVEVIKIHLRKAGQNPDKYDLHGLSGAANNMVGREIEQCINAAKIKTFGAKKRGIDQGILTEVLRRKPRIVKTMGDEVKELVDWVGYDTDVDDGIRAHFASKPNRAGGQFKGGAFEIIAGGATK